MVYIKKFDLWKESFINSLNNGDLILDSQLLDEFQTLIINKKDEIFFVDKKMYFKDNEIDILRLMFELLVACHNNVIFQIQNNNENNVNNPNENM